MAPEAGQNVLGHHLAQLAALGFKMASKDRLQATESIRSRVQQLKQLNLAAPPLELDSSQVAPALSSLRSPSRRSTGPPELVLLQLPDRLLDRLLHPGVQCCLGRLHLAGPLLELGLLLRR